MRAVVFALAGLVAVAAPALAAVEEPAQWIPWAEDPQETPVPLSSDIASLQVGTTGTDLHLEFASHELAETPLATSEVRFVAEQSGQADVRFAWDDGPRLWIGDEEVSAGWAVADGSGPGGWHLQVQWGIMGLFVGQPFALRGLQVAAGPVPDEATGPDLEFTPEASGGLAVSVATLEAGVTVEGPDFGGGTSVGLDARGEPLLAYYIYDGERGEERGIYLARIAEGALDGTLDRDSHGFAAERIGDTRVSRDNGRDAQMRTQVAHDGTDAFVLFTDDPAVDNDEDGPGHLGTPDSVYVLARTEGAWKREDPTPGGASDVGPEDVSDLAARDGLVVAAVPVGRDVWVAQRTGPGSWQVLARLPSANNAKLAIDSQGGIHVAYAVYESEEGSWRDGVLYYASSRDGYRAQQVGANIDSGWEEPETDGSFAIAVGPQDEVALLWNDGRARDRDQEQRLAILRSGQWTHEFAPLVPSHGNPQYTMRLGYTAAGHLVAASGYGGTDTLAVRGPSGGWAVTELPRYDVWDMVVSPAGQVYFGYTQPHGGTTVALSVYGVSPAFQAASAAEGGEAAPDGDSAEPVQADAMPRLAPSAGIAALVALVGLAAALSRRGR
jgi:hypothetical protein